MLFTTKDFRFRFWTDLDSDLAQRFTRLKDDSRKLGEELDRANAFQLAAADLFVEKAQVHLTQRADHYTVAGGMFAFMALAIIAFMIYVTGFVIDVSKYLTGDSWKLLILLVLKAAAVAGFAGAAIYFCASLSRAFFHEATTLYNRRHALRFGRMFVYLKFGASKTEREEVIKVLGDFAHFSPAPPAAPAGPAVQTPQGGTTGQTGDAKPSSAFYESLLAFLARDISAEELEKAFGWNLETHTGFRDMKPEQMSTNIYSRTIDVMGKVVESLAKMKTAKE